MRGRYFFAMDMLGPVPPPVTLRSRAWVLIFGFLRFYRDAKKFKKAPFSLPYFGDHIHLCAGGTRKLGRSKLCYDLRVFR
jgi:hypothetical protein